MKVEVEWLGGVAFSAETESGHRLLLDGPPEHGGENRGARPMETLLAGAIGCSAFDVVHILRKSKQELTALTVRTEGLRAETEPKVFTRIHLHFVAAGKDLQDSAVERAVRLSVEKYCSALRMLAASCEIEYSWEIQA